MEAPHQTSLKNCIKEMSTWTVKLIIIAQKFEIGQLFMVKNHVCHTFEPKCLLDYRALKILSDSTPLVTLNGKEWIKNIKDVKPTSTLELIENAWNSFPDSIKINCQILLITQILILTLNNVLTFVVSIYFQIAWDVPVQKIHHILLTTIIHDKQI